MQLDGLHPKGIPGTGAVSGGGNGVAGPGKGDPKAGGKSFAAALDKAKAAAQPQPAQPTGPGTGTGAAETAPLPESGSQIDLIRMRLQSGYYNSKKVDEALSDKLSGYFDDAV